MEGVRDYRPERSNAALPAALTPAERAARAPRQVRVSFLPILASTLVSIHTVEWNGRVSVDYKVMGLRLEHATRADWERGPQAALQACLAGLAAHLTA